MRWLTWRALSVRPYAMDVSAASAALAAVAGTAPAAAASMLATMGPHDAASLMTSVVAAEPAALGALLKKLRPVDAAYVLAGGILVLRSSTRSTLNLLLVLLLRVFV